MHFRRRVLVLLTTLATLIGANLLASTPAQAATSCSGTVTHRQPIRIPGRDTIIGELTIYYNSSNGGTNSACFYHRGPSYGVAAHTEVMIMRCAQKSGEGQGCTSTTAPDSDSGNFAYHAGPVGVTGTANYCVAAIGWITWEHPNPDVGKMNMGVFEPITQGC
ncbi:hypothetical protein [Streptomyces sp. F001]|uniref:hypothetical protein n=1 Tax=Streptomyces sp. F001 TaxID=1510026 RepID=UPI0019CFCBB9|nr:hypothetical protein [Streptomyces sp. F001]